MKKISIILLVAILLLALSTSVYANQNSPVVDTAQIFSANERAAIEDACDRAEEQTNVKFMVVTTEQTLYGEDILQDYGYSDEESRVILVITVEPSENFYDMYTYGKADSKISDLEVDLILDAPDVYNEIKSKSGNVAAGAIAFVEHTADKILTSNWAFSNFSVGNFVAIAFIALSGAFVVCLLVFLSYKKKKRSESYPLDAYTKLTLTESHDVFLGSFVTKRRIDTSSGGGRSGGGSRGGGGGHRGGR